jgi:hypothetical protein
MRSRTTARAGSTPSATAAVTSRSLTMPTSECRSYTGKAPTAYQRMRSAATTSGSSTSTVTSTGR